MPVSTSKRQGNNPAPRQLYLFDNPYPRAEYLVGGHWGQFDCLRFGAIQPGFHRPTAGLHLDSLTFAPVNGLPPYSAGITVCGRRQLIGILRLKPEDLSSFERFAAAVERRFGRSVHHSTGKGRFTLSTCRPQTDIYGRPYVWREQIRTTVALSVEYQAAVADWLRRTRKVEGEAAQ